METLSHQLVEHFEPKVPDRLKPYVPPVYGALVGLDIWIPVFLARQVFTAERIAQLPQSLATKPIEVMYNFIDLIANNPVGTVLPFVTIGAIGTGCKLLARRRRS